MEYHHIQYKCQSLHNLWQFIPGFTEVQNWISVVRNFVKYGVRSGRTIHDFVVEVNG